MPLAIPSRKRRKRIQSIPNSELEAKESTRIKKSSSMNNLDKTVTFQENLSPKSSISR